MKRKICVIITMSMIIAALSGLDPVSAETVDFSDYKPIAKPENMMTNPTSGNVFGNINSNVTKANNENSG